jgi:hypothetical protein
MQVSTKNIWILLYGSKKSQGGVPVEVFLGVFVKLFFFMWFRNFPEGNISGESTPQGVLPLV